MPQAEYLVIVDDDDAMRNSLARLLRAYGLECRTYGSASDFLDSLQSGVPDCLIVDMNMPVISGLELMRELSLRGLRIPSIVITAAPDEATRHQCQALGAKAYLVKPVTAEVLLDAIHSARPPPHEQ